MAFQKEISKEKASTLGPIDLLVVEFPGNKFTGVGLRELHQLTATGTISIIDLVIITKNEAGEISAMDLHDLGPDASASLVQLRATISQILTRDDIEAVGEQLANNSTAAIMMYENSWAARTKQAIAEANGKVVMHARVPHEVVQETLDDLAALEASST